MYSCGPTVYRYAHLGNMRTYLLSDLIRRVAQRHGVTVVSCQNITDVGHLADDGQPDPGGEDKILAQARAEGRTALEMARGYENAFAADCRALNIYPADYPPRASESIGLMIDMIAKLIDTGHAYAADGGNVYFDARSFPGYGELSGNSLSQLRPGTAPVARPTRGTVPRGLGAVEGRAGRPRADLGRPWGTGFPGWHTECSAMSLHYLGDVIDIHTGGIDLRFPHHEDERAQSDSVAGHEVVQHWVHGEHLLFEGRKMAKSTGNVVLVADLTASGLDPLAARLAFLEHHYRQQLNLTWETLAAADATLRRWRGQVASWAASPSRPMCAEVTGQIAAALDNDLDTRAAVAALRSLEKDPEIPPGSKFETFMHADQVLGLDLAADIGRDAAPAPLPGGAAQKLAERREARAASDWANADRLRDELAAIGVIVSDTPDGQTWTAGRGRPGRGRRGRRRR